MATATFATNTHSSGLTKRARYEKHRGTLDVDRSSFLSSWTELAEYLAPRRPRFSVTDKNRGDRRTQNIIDSAPIFAKRTLQSGMHAGLTSPARPWMRLTTPDPDLAELPAVKKWLDTVTQRMLTVFLRSNLYNALPVVYGDMAVFGTAAVGILEDDKDLLRAYCYPIGSYFVGLDERGIASTFIRDYTMTIRQLIAEFGRQPGTRDIDWSRFSLDVKAAWENAEYERQVEVCWYVGPNEDYDPRALEAKYRFPWTSCHFERGRADETSFGPGARGMLRESGFRQFPVLVPRWDVTDGDTYGTDGPGWVTLGDVKQLQLMQRQKAKAIAKAIDPPLVGPTSLQNQVTSLVPGRITYEDTRTGSQGLRPIHEMRLEGLQYMTLDMEETRQRVRRGFYEDLFLMLAMSDAARGAQPVTAEEIRARQEEKLIALGPVLERTNDELLDPLVDRTFSIMLEAGFIPPPPKELEGVDLKVEYLSIMAQAQKLVGVVGQDRFLQSVGQLATLFPQVVHKVDINEVVDAYADQLGVRPDLVRSNEDADQLAEAQAQAAAAQAQAEQAARLGQAAHALGSTPAPGAGTALDEVLTGGGLAA
jgi:hypothetical protein